MPSESSRRLNGFEPPFPALQICTWIYLPILMVQFLLFVSPILPLAASVPCTVLFFAFALASAYYTYLACITDPIDVHLAKHLVVTGEMTTAQQQPSCCYRLPFIPDTQDSNNNDNNNNDDDGIQQQRDEEEAMKYCWVCETSVADHSMHCKYCNKCVSHFDHHCLWLNTCVGSANYTYFYRTLWTTCLMLVVHVGCLLGTVVDLFTGGPSRQRANDEWLGSDLWGLVAGVNVFFLISNVASLSAVGQLLYFHLTLRRKGLTTYQFIITDNARRREQFQKREARRSNRLSAIVKARREGNLLLATRLQMGQYCCPPCDPLPADDDEEAAAGGATAATTTPADINGNGTPAATVSNNDTNTSAYAELSDDVDVMMSAEDDEKTSMSSERDLAHTLGASIGESSSSQLEHSSAKLVRPPKDHVPTSKSASLAEEKSKEMTSSNGANLEQTSSNVLPMESNDDATEASGSVEQERKNIMVDAKMEKVHSDPDNI